MSEKISFCRICSGGCGLRLTIDEADRIVSIRGDDDSPLTAGYACFKGRQAAESHHGPNRLLQPLKRQPDGSYTQISSRDALEEISAKIVSLIERYGPRALAIFLGNGGMFNVPAYTIHQDFLRAIGSDQYFSTLTIDQSAKYVSFGRLGGWSAGYPAFEDMEVAMLFGANPLVSHASLGFLQVDPVRRLKKERARGLKLIVIDPRVTETARTADLVLQPFPGQDAAIAGGILREILVNGWEDVDFCRAHVEPGQIQALREAVEPFTTDNVEARAGLEAGQIHRAAALFARDSKIGSVTVATGPSMSPFSNLAQHLADCINVVCGRFLRAGQPVHRIDAMGPTAPVHAEVVPPLRGWEAGGGSRVRPGATRNLFGERPTGTLSDEILIAGDEKVRALLIDGGDPLTSFPDQQRAARAMSELDLLVAIDPWPTPTTKFAHYILPPRMMFERSDLPMHLPGYACWPGAWAQYTPAAISTPPGSDLVEDWYVFWHIAKRLGKPIVFNQTTPLGMDVPPTTDDLIEIILKDGPIPLSELREHPSGIDLDLSGQVVQSARPEAAGHRFCLMPADVKNELDRFVDMERTGDLRSRNGVRYEYLLISRRMRDMFNSNGRFVRTVRKRTPYNPAYLHPDDLEILGLNVGDRVEITSAHGRIPAIVDRDANLKRGVVSMAHGWGSLPGNPDDPALNGSPVNALIDTAVHYEAVNAMPHMSSVPVNIHPSFSQDTICTSGELA